IKLSKDKREIIGVATSSSNYCHYCMVAQETILRIYAKNPLIADQVARNYRQAHITPRQRAMLDFPLKVALQPQQLEDADFDPLREFGFSNDDIWDIGGIAAFFALSNRMAHLTNMRPNDEFYTMGRTG